LFSFSLLLGLYPQQTKTLEEHKIFWCISHKWPINIQW